MAETTTFADGFDGPEVIVFGLPAPQLLVVVGGAALAYCTIHLPVPVFVTAPATILAIAIAAVLGWGTWASRPVLEWVFLAGRFATSPRIRTFALLSEVHDEPGESATTGLSGDVSDHPWALWLEAAAAPLPPLPEPPPDDDDVEEAAPHRKGRPQLFVLPTTPSADDATDAVILPFARALADDEDDEVGLVADANSPIFAGATRKITFFSLNGGTGKTTLATEVAGVLAARGRHSRDGVTAERLKVALIDLDLQSATVSVRLGIPHKAISDSGLDQASPPGDLDDYMVTHHTGLRALLGPPKPVATGHSILPDQIAKIVSQLEGDGYHFIFFDVGSDLSEVTTWVLGAVHDIFIVLPPTAGGILNTYRATEVLRRMGLRHKLSYVVNRDHGDVDLRDVMADLSGSIRAAIPYDMAVEQAENAHRLVALESGSAATAINGLAAHLYPPLQTGRGKSQTSLPWRRDVS